MFHCLGFNVECVVLVSSVQGLGFRVSDLVVGTWEFRASGLGFGIWGLLFGV